MPFVPYKNPLNDHSVKSEKAHNRHELANTNNKKGRRRRHTQDKESEAQLQKKNNVRGDIDNIPRNIKIVGGENSLRK